MKSNFVKGQDKIKVFMITLHSEKKDVIVCCSGAYKSER